MNQLILTLKKLWVFLLVHLRRDTRSVIGFVARYLLIFSLCFIYGLFFKAALWQKNIQLNGHSIDLPLFLVSGLMMARLVPLSIRIFDETLSQLKQSGLMEWMLVTPSSLWELFASKTLWNIFCVLTELMALIGFAKLWIGTPVRPFLQGAVLLPIFFMFVATAGIGMIISGLSLFLLRRGHFLFTAFFQVSAAFGGVFFPTTLFTGKLRILSYVSDSLPITHALRAVRLALVREGASNSTADGRILAMMALILAVTGFIVLQRGLIWAKKNGEFSKELYN